MPLFVSMLNKSVRSRNMKRKGRARTAIAVSISALLICIFLFSAAFFIMVQRTFTPVDGVVQVKGIKSEVEIYRDRWGVPHIYANTIEDLFFAQGYIHAQDRLWQIDLYRRLGSGTLSEVLGETPLEIDRFMRTIGIRQTAEKQVAGMDEDLRTVLESYAAGVNAFIHQYPDRLPLEFTILGYKPADWHPVDTMTVANIIAWKLGKNWKVELLRGRLVQKFGVKKTNQILPLYPDDSPLFIANELLDNPLGNPDIASLPGGADGIGK